MEQFKVDFVTVVQEVLIYSFSHPQVLSVAMHFHRMKKPRHLLEHLVGWHQVRELLELLFDCWMHCCLETEKSPQLDMNMCAVRMRCLV